jgi:hypothetical protein
MPVYQTNIWICEICGKIISVTEETTPYSDPVVVPPTDIDWNYVGEFPNEKLSCPDCLLANKFDT